MALRRTHHIAGKVAVYIQALVLVAPILVGGMPRVGAAELHNRSVQLSTAQLGAEATHSFSFSVASNSPLASISFLYCTNSPLASEPCTAPAGLDLTNVSLDAQTGNEDFAYQSSYSTANSIVITRPVDVAVPGPSGYVFKGILNPTTSAQTTYVRIATYATPDASGAATDFGAVTFATQDIFRVDAYVPPYITFCAGVFVTLNCNSVTGTYVDIGELGPGRTATGVMQFSGATNDPGGYTTYLSGYTMTSGNNIITPLNINAGSALGSSQFGLNLRANSNPSVGLEPNGVGSLTPAPGYGTPNSYRFVNGEAIASTSFPTDFRILTASFIVNVSRSQPPGIYVTTMTYTAIASF